MPSILAPLRDSTGFHYVGSRLSVVHANRVIPAFYYKQPRSVPFQAPNTWRELVQAHVWKTVRYVCRMKERAVALRPRPPRAPGGW